MLAKEGKFKSWFQNVAFIPKKQACVMFFNTLDIFFSSPSLIIWYTSRVKDQKRMWYREEAK